MKVEEPAIALDNYQQRSRRHAQMHASHIPCCYTDEEMKSEIQLSLKSKDASDDAVAAMYSKWGL